MLIYIQEVVWIEDQGEGTPLSCTLHFSYFRTSFSFSLWLGEWDHFTRRTETFQMISNMYSYITLHGFSVSSRWGGTTLCVASRMLLLHMQEIVFVDSQEGLLSSRGGGGGADILAPGLQWWHFHALKHDAAQNEMWLVALPVNHMTSLMVLGHSKRPRCPYLLPSVWRSGYAGLAKEILSYSSTVMNVALALSYLAMTCHIVYNTLSHVCYFNIFGGIICTYVVSTTSWIYTCPVSSGMCPRQLSEVVCAIGFKSISKAFRKAFAPGLFTIG